MEFPSINNDDIAKAFAAKAHMDACRAEAGVKEEDVLFDWIKEAKAQMRADALEISKLKTHEARVAAREARVAKMVSQIKSFVKTIEVKEVKMEYECDCCGALTSKIHRTSQGGFHQMCSYCYKTLIGTRLEAGHLEDATVLKAVAQCFNVLEDRIKEGDKD
jgi:hypothetical protein